MTLNNHPWPCWSAIHFAGQTVFGTKSMLLRSRLNYNTISEVLGQGCLAFAEAAPQQQALSSASSPLRVEEVDTCLRSAAQQALTDLPRCQGQAGIVAAGKLPLESGSSRLLQPAQSAVIELCHASQACRQQWSCPGSLGQSQHGRQAQSGSTMDGKEITTQKRHPPSPQSICHARCRAAPMGTPATALPSLLSAW